ncbi:alpha/beta-hydrolase [Aulographum hederae CBS 113979]|uniref:Alpha/beta-hydrolase n=1 Tax=Aulographum hederae CBS 113979 TaxID=1176131 RepID=A0A6G1H646_9PEZI|nr:alpha/beta-hydrolase [Aulographum hederae CBS 113979]
MITRRPLASANSILASSASRLSSPSRLRVLHTFPSIREDARLKDFGRVIEDEYSTIRQKYETPKNPIILAHGLLGFDEIRLAGSLLPGIEYWRGIKEAMASNGIEVIITAVPRSGSIEARAEKLGESIAEKAQGKSVNIIAGLDARYMISRLKPPNVKVLSLTTIASPHRGSAFADYMFDRIGPTMIPKLYKILEGFGFETGAFSQLTRKYMAEKFNPKTPDLEGVRYYSYGASLDPTFWSVFRPSHNIIQRLENAVNDGLVSVPSSRWGEYKGTLVGVSHLDLINWTNRLKYLMWSLTGSKRQFNAVAFYLDIADMLAKEGL